MKLRDLVDKLISPAQLERLKENRKLVNLFDDIRAVGSGRNLDRLGKIYRTDKVGSHHYTRHYAHHFRPFKRKRINLLEIGVVGYEHPYAGGNSLRMWKKFFPFAKIFAIDIYDKSKIQERRVTIWQGSQIDFDFLEGILNKIGELQIIIDDGSHENEHVIKSFEFLFPKLAMGGIYVVEDIQTAYWPRYGGVSDQQMNHSTSMNYFLQLAHGLNYQEFIDPDYEASDFDRSITQMHFYHNMVFIYKGDNSEPSNIVVNNTPNSSTG